MQLATLVTQEREHPGGIFIDYDVVDTRTDELLASRAFATSAGEVVDELNRRYPADGVWPARDTLVHEIVGMRISGEAG